VEENQGGEGQRRDPLAELEARIDAAIEEARPRVKRALEDLDARVDAAMTEIRPRVDNAMDEVRPRVDKFITDVQPRLDSVLRRVEAKIGEMRRDLEERARREQGAGPAGTLPPVEPPSGAEGEAPGSGDDPPSGPGGL
jgi:ElaB/YqjD/DUF883 family membrane-anchored ribosome-binding protein